MSKVVSFRCSEDLDEFLEEEAQERMTTKSTVAQMLVAERVRQLQGEDELEGSEDGDELDRADESDQEEGGDGELPPIFEKYADKWSRRGDDYEHDFSVKVPREGRSADYYQYKSVDHCADRLRKEFED